MTAPADAPRPVRPRDLALMSEPRLWSKWPFLPVVRPSPEGGEAELGVLYDPRRVSGTYGFSATVFLVLCGDPHNTTYAELRIMQTVLGLPLASWQFEP